MSGNQKLCKLEIRKATEVCDEQR